MKVRSGVSGPGRESEGEHMQGRIRKQCRRYKEVCMICEDCKGTMGGGWKRDCIGRKRGIG